MKICPKCNAKFAENETLCSFDREILKLDLTDLVGKILQNKYLIETKLGQGGMGTVFRAKHLLLDELVAIKILSPALNDIAQYKRRFLREGQAAQLFQHPNATRVYDVSVDEKIIPAGLLFMVQEYVEGVTLDEELKQHGRFSPKEALSLIEPIANALDEAHKAGVIHRDIKPHNIMIKRFSNGNIRVKLLDLGIAKIQNPSSSDNFELTPLTEEGAIVGTYHYMSPEQAGEIDRRRILG